MKQSLFKLLALLFAFTLIAAACGDDDDSPSDTTDDDADDTSGDDDDGDNAAESLLDGAIPCENQHEGKTVSIFSPVRNNENDPNTIADYVEGYDPLVECTGVTIDFQGTDQFETQVNVRLEGGDPPDVIDYPQPGLMIGHARRDFLVPLPGDMVSTVEADFPEGLVVAGTVDDTLYAVPARTNVKSFVWYSPSAFADAGYEIPTTMEGLLELSDQIVADGGVPWCIGAESGVATGWVLTDWMEDFMMRVQGGEVYDQWTTHEIPFNDPKVVEVVDVVGSIVKNPDYLGGENLVKAIATTKFQDGGLGVATGDCFMHRQASFYAGNWPEGTNVAEDGDVWLFQLPSYEGEPSAMLVGGDLYAAATDKPETFDVLRYTGSVAYQLHEINTRQDLGANVNINLDDIEDPYIKFLSELSANSEVVRFDGADIMPGAVGAGTFWTEVTDWVIGGSTQDFVDNVEASWPDS